MPGSTCREVDVSMGTSDDQKALVVTYQRLRPGVEIKRAIPEDGHRGWKKYGSKSIQNANFCRYLVDRSAVSTLCTAVAARTIFLPAEFVL